MELGNSFELLLQKGVNEVVEQQYLEAEKTASRLTALDPDSADGYHLAAIAKQHRYLWKESIELLHKAILNAPYNAGLYNLRGFAFMSLNELAAAEKDFNEAISLEESDTGYRNLVLLRILQDRSDEAVELLTKQIRKNPSNADNLAMMGDLMARIGQKEKADDWHAAAEKARQEKKIM